VSWIKGSEVWWGLAPFIVADFCRIAILVAFPALTLYLPRLLNL
jgi:hypothetical protein